MDGRQAAATEVERTLEVTFRQLLEADAAVASWDGSNASHTDLNALIRRVESNLADIERRLCDLRAA